LDDSPAEPGETEEARVTESLEIEVKIRYGAAAEALEAIRSAGAVEIRPRHFEENRVYDTRYGDLAARHALLRVRETSDGDGILTWKEKIATDLNAKVRREWETKVASAQTLAAILERAGFVPTYRYQKYRTVFRLGEATIDLDETPMGCFVEIEASAPALASAAARLGVKERDFLIDDYRTLYADWLRARELPPSDMIFEAGAASNAPAQGAAPAPLSRK
jgi:adenylate cyclase class 2